MGISKQLVQVLVHHSIFDRGYGLIVKNAMDGKADVIIFDQMLIMYVTCYIPVAADTSLEEHIVDYTTRHYLRVKKQNAHANTLYVICEDGGQGTKPAVRDRRTDQVPTEALMYFKRNQVKISGLIMERLAAASMNVVHILGAAAHGAPITCRFDVNSSRAARAFSSGEGPSSGGAGSGSGSTCQFTEESLALDKFQAGCSEIEADLLMFCYARHHAARYPEQLMLIATKDSDSIATAMTLASPGSESFMGNLVIEFNNPLLSWRKDFDRCVTDFRIPFGEKGVGGKGSGSPPSYRCSNTRDSRNLVRALVRAFDVIEEADLMRYFGAQVAQLKILFLDNEDPDKVERRFTRFADTCFRSGCRGSVFRRVLMRYLDPNSRPMVHAFGADLYASRIHNDVSRALERLFTSTASYEVATADNCRQWRLEGDCAGVKRFKADIEDWDADDNGWGGGWGRKGEGRGGEPDEDWDPTGCGFRVLTTVDSDPGDAKPSPQAGSSSPGWSDAFVTCDPTKLPGTQSALIKGPPFPLRAVTPIKQLVKLYAENKIPGGSYMEFLDANSSRGLKYIRVTGRPKTRGGALACVLAGADYNLQVPKMGTAQIVGLLTNSRFYQLASVMDFKPDNNPVRMLSSILSMTTIKTKPSMNHVEIRAFLDCAWRTMCYTWNTWLLKSPAPSPEYGFEINESDERFYFKFDATTEFKKGFSLFAKEGEWHAYQQA